jgi:hypothetical protein
VQPVQAGGAGRQLGGVDVAVDPERRFVGVVTGVAVGDGQQPDLAPFKALANGLQATRCGAAAA